MALWSHLPVPVVPQALCLSPIIYKYYRATATGWYIYSTGTPWWFTLEMVFFVKNKAFRTLQRFFAVWARLELLDLDIFPAPRFGGAVEQEILRSLCMHYIPVPPRAAANKQTFLLVKEREKKITLHKVHQQMWPVNPTQPFLLIKRIQCICNVGVTSRFGEAGSAKTWQLKAAKSAVLRFCELLHPQQRVSLEEGLPNISSSLQWKGLFYFHLAQNLSLFSIISNTTRSDVHVSQLNFESLQGWPLWKKKKKNLENI